MTLIGLEELYLFYSVLITFWSDDEPDDDLFSAFTFSDDVLDLIFLSLGYLLEDDEELELYFFITFFSTLIAG